MSNSVNAPENNGLEDRGENGVAVPGADVSLRNPEDTLEPILVDVGSRNAQHVGISSHTNVNTRQENQQETQKNPAWEEREVSLHVISKMLQAQQLAIAPLQSHQKTPSTAAPETAPRA